MAADEWADLFARENSGTHNNQWIVVDYKQFHKAKQGTSLAQRKTALVLLQRSHIVLCRRSVREMTTSPSLVPLLPNTVWLLEQMPGIVEKADVTHTLLQSQLYVPSYNIPYFPSIFNISGYR